jgi:hypothetical protein
MINPFSNSDDDEEEETAEPEKEELSESEQETFTDPLGENGDGEDGNAGGFVPDRGTETDKPSKGGSVPSRKRRRRDRSPGKDDLETEEGPKEEATHEGMWSEEEQEGVVLSDRDETHLAALAPEHINEDEEHYEYLRTRDKFIRSYFIAGWPDEIKDGHLENLFADNTDEIDVALHIDRVPTEEALAELRDKIRDLEADRQRAEEDGLIVEAHDLARQRDEYVNLRDDLKSSDDEMVDVSMYITVSAESPRELDRVSDRVEEKLTDKGFTPVLKSKDQERTHRSTTPSYIDDLGKKRSMMSEAVGALMPFASGTLIQDEGVPIGEHAINGSPIIYDLFTHEQGYNVLTIGNIGAGKSFSTKLRLLRRRFYDADPIIIMLDPLEGFTGVNSALGGEPIVVGGQYGLNPLEIQAVPPEVLKNNPRIDPGGAKIKDLKSFFDAFFAMRGDSLGKKWDTLQRALRTAYERKSINLDDPSTHANESPTIRGELIPVLLEMVTSIEEHTILNDVVDEESEVEEVLEEASEVTQEEKKRAAELLLAMEPFLEGGTLSNLGSHSEFDIQDEDVVYLDLQQQEARGSLGLMMNLLFSSVYERAKQSDRPIIFCIDEAKYIMKDKSTLEFLAQATRHSRHYDLSLQFITQTIDEFFQHEEAKVIADQCAHKFFFRTRGLTGDIASSVGMNEVQEDFVRNKATAGEDEQGYSECLFGVEDRGWYPIHIRASDKEAGVIDQEGAELDISDDENVPEDIKEMKQELVESYGENVTVSVTPESIVPEVRVEDDDGESKMVVDEKSLYSEGPNMEDVIDRVIENEIHPETAVNEANEVPEASQ